MFRAYDTGFGRDVMTSIRALDASDFDNWLDVYRFYAEHYKSDLTDDGISTTWAWLMGAGHPLTGIVAEDKGQLIGCTLPGNAKSITRRKSGISG